MKIVSFTCVCYRIVILADKRFNKADKRQKLPPWIQRFLKESSVDLSIDLAAEQVCSVVGALVLLCVCSYAYSCAVDKILPEGNWSTDRCRSFEYNFVICRSGVKLVVLNVY